MAYTNYGIIRSCNTFPNSKIELYIVIYFYLTIIYITIYIIVK